MFSRTQLRQCNTNNVGRIILILPEHVAGIDKSKVHCVKESKPERCFLYIMKATDELSRVWQHCLFDDYSAMKCLDGIVYCRTDYLILTNDVMYLKVEVKRVNNSKLMGK